MEELSHRWLGEARQLRQTRTVDPPPTVLQTVAPHTVLQNI